MKKFLLGVSSLALAGIFAFTGCSCSKKGTYKFEKYEVPNGVSTTTVTCSEENKQLPGLKSICDVVEKESFELTKDEIIYSKDGKEADRSKYKIEDKKIYTREKDEDEWVEFGAYEKGAIIVTKSDNIGEYTVYYKK